MGSRMPNQLLDVRLHTIAISGLSRVRTELPQLLLIPPLVPHPVQANRQSAIEPPQMKLPQSLRFSEAGYHECVQKVILF